MERSDHIAFVVCKHGPLKNKARALSEHLGVDLREEPNKTDSEKYLKYGRDVEYIDEDTTVQNGVSAEFKNDRAANLEPRRNVIYKLEECEMVLDDDKKKQSFNKGVEFAKNYITEQNLKTDQACQH